MLLRFEFTILVVVVVVMVLLDDGCGLGRGRSDPLLTVDLGSRAYSTVFIDWPIFEYLVMFYCVVDTLLEDKGLLTTYYYFLESDEFT